MQWGGKLIRFWEFVAIEYTKLETFVTSIFYGLYTTHSGIYLDATLCITNFYLFEMSILNLIGLKLGRHNRLLQAVKSY